jgi:membrane protease subunit (stomatin/prohibitin family)
MVCAGGSRCVLALSGTGGGGSGSAASTSRQQQQQQQQQQLGGARRSQCGHRTLSAHCTHKGREHTVSVHCADCAPAGEGNPLRPRRPYFFDHQKAAAVNLELALTAKFHPPRARHQPQFPFRTVASTGERSLGTTRRTSSADPNI